MKDSFSSAWLALFLTVVFAPECIALASTTLEGVKPSGAQESNPALKIEFVISEPCALMAFLGTLAERAHTTVWVKDWYWKKRPSSYSVDDKAMIVLYRDVIDGDCNHYTFVSETGRELDLYQKILSLAAGSRTLPELLTRLQPVVKEKDFETMKKVFEYFAPVYRDLVWQPRLASLEKQLEEYRRLAVASKMSERLSAVQKFMKAPWVDGLSFTIVLVPLPFNGKSTHGESLGPVQIVELKPGSSFKSHADVVFHEDCHALWFSIKDVPAADREFATAGGEVLPLTELYEGMATALGQGWFTREAFGKTPKSWYGDTTINLYAHKVFPLYAEYLKAGRPIDREFGRRATEIYFKQFPDADQYVALTSTYMVIAEQIPDAAQFKSEIARALPRLRSWSATSPLDAVDSLKLWKDFDGRHACILCGATSLEKLAALDVAQSQIELLRRTAGAVTLPIGKRQILFCVADTPADQQKMLFECLKKNKWPLPIK